jgi:hypothetical protein
VDPTLVVVFYNLPDNARFLIEQAYKTSTTASSKERRLLEDYLKDEAQELKLERNKDTGSVYWEGHHYAVALTPELAEDIETRTNIRRTTVGEEIEAHRIDFFRRGNTSSDMKAVRYTSIQKSGWEQPKKTFKPSFNYTNPNPPQHQGLWGKGTGQTDATPPQYTPTLTTIKVNATPVAGATTEPDDRTEMKDTIATLMQQLEAQKLRMDQLLSLIPPPPAAATRENDK